MNQVEPQQADANRETNAQPIQQTDAQLPQSLDESLDAKQFENEVKQPVIDYKKEILVGKLEAMAASTDEKKCVEIRIMPEYMSVNHKPVKYRQLYGDLIYTHDSDLVAVLMHLGYFRMMDTTPIGMVTVKTIVRMLPDQPHYPSALRNNLLSREWYFRPTEKRTCSYKVEGCWLVKRNGTLLSLKKNVAGSTDYIPTFVPAYSDRAVATRSTTATAERRQRNLPEQTLRATTIELDVYTTAGGSYVSRIKENVMSCRVYQGGLLSFHLRLKTVKYRSCNDWEIMNRTSMESCGVPLPSEHAALLHSDLTWEDIKWGQTFVQINEQQYSVIRLFYVKRS